MPNFNPFKWLEKWIDKKIEHIPSENVKAVSDQFITDFHFYSRMRSPLSNISTLPKLKGNFQMIFDKPNIKFYIDKTELIMYDMPTLEYKKLAEKNNQPVTASGWWESNKFKVATLKFID